MSKHEYQKCSESFEVTSKIDCLETFRLAAGWLAARDEFFRRNRELVSSTIFVFVMKSITKIQWTPSRGGLQS